MAEGCANQDAQQPVRHSLTFVNELEKRIADVADLKQETESIQSSIVEDGEEDGSSGRDLLQMLTLMAHHRTRIKELQELTSLNVEFEEETVEESVLIPPYKAVEVGDLLEGVVVMWCPEQAAGYVPRVLLREVRREVEEKSEEMTPAVFTDTFEPWKAGQSITKVGCDIVTSGKGEAQLALMSDTKNHKVHVMNRRGELVRSFGGMGEDPGQLNWPSGMTIVGDRVFISESANHRVSVWPVNGRCKSGFGTEGTAPGQFKAPFGICAVADSRVAVVDQRNHRVQVFDLEGEFLTEFGKYGVNPLLGHLNKPVRVAAGCAAADGAAPLVAVWCVGHRNVVSVFNEADGAFLRCIYLQGSWKSGELVARMAISNGMLRIMCTSAGTGVVQLPVFTLAGTFVRRCILEKWNGFMPME